MDPNTSLLFLNLTGSSGKADLNHSLDQQPLKLVQYSITWDSQADSATGGEFVSIDLGGIFSQTRINSNVSTIHDTMVLLNDVDVQLTNKSVQIPLHMDRNLKHSFNYNVYIADGTLAANVTSVNLIFSHDDGSRI